MSVPSYQSYLYQNSSGGVDYGQPVSPAHSPTHMMSPSQPIPTVQSFFFFLFMLTLHNHVACFCEWNINSVKLSHLTSMNIQHVNKNWIDAWINFSFFFFTSNSLVREEMWLTLATCMFILCFFCLSVLAWKKMKSAAWRLSNGISKPPTDSQTQSDQFTYLGCARKFHPFQEPEFKKPSIK